MALSSGAGLSNKAVLTKYVASLIQSNDRFVSRKITTIGTDNLFQGVLAVEDIDSSGPRNLIRGAGDPYYPMGRDIKINSVPFNCKDYGSTVPVDEISRRKVLGNTGKLLNLEQSSLGQAALELMENEEARLGTVLGNTANWATNLIGNTDFAYFNAASNPGNPLQVIQAAANLGGRFDANTVIFGSRAVYDATKANAILIAGLPQNTYGALASDDAIAAFLGINAKIAKVFVMQGTQLSTRNPDNAARANLGGDWIWVGYMPDQDQMKVQDTPQGLKPTATGILRCEAFAPEVIYDSQGRMHYYSVSCPTDFVVPSSSLGTIITAVLEP